MIETRKQERREEQDTVITKSPMPSEKRKTVWPEKRTNFDQGFKPKPLRQKSIALPLVPLWRSYYKVAYVRVETGFLFGLLASWCTRL